MIDPIAKLLGEWSYSMNIGSIALRIGLALLMSAIVGCERSAKRHSAGMRTFMLVMLAGTIAMLLDSFIAQASHIYVLSAAVIIGLSTITVNSIIFGSSNRIKGLTTAVALWTCGIIGLSVGAGYYTVTLISFTALMFSLSLFPRFEVYLRDRSNHFEIHLELKSATALNDFISTIRKLGLHLDEIERNPAYDGSGLSVYSVGLSISNEDLKKYKTHAEIIEALSTIEYVTHIEEMSR
ncbi:MAG: MgtC/SapB family protein [Clostridia bacterium]|nr:MgtC/SapB family protein [Clostridia bacterium]